MRTLMIAVFATLTLAGTAHAERVGCREVFGGGERCKQADGHVTETIPNGEGGVRKTSTNPHDWKSTDGRGVAVTPPDRMIRNSPMLRRDYWGRVTEPWEPKKQPTPIDGGWKAPRSDPR